jgi:phosphocarrier protein
MVERTLTIVGRLGLHARAAAKLVRLTSEFQSKVSLRRADGSVTADAKSILSVLMLAAGRGSELQASAEGIDEELAMDAIAKLFASGFGEIEAESSL